MKKTKQVDEVVIRRFKEGDLIAIFPYQISDYRGNVNSYQHIGQHSGADLSIIHNTKPVKEADAQCLLKELKDIGYNVKVVQRVQYHKYSEAYQKAKKEIS